MEDMQDMEVVFGSLAAQNEGRSFTNASPVGFWIGDLRNSRTEGISNETIESKDGGGSEAWRIDCLMDKSQYEGLVNVQFWSFWTSPEKSRKCICVRL